MEREDNDLGNLSGWDADKEWQSFISLDNGTRRRGPRDWSSPEADMDFDAADLPTATPQAPASFSAISRGFMDFVYAGNTGLLCWLLRCYFPSAYCIY